MLALLLASLLLQGRRPGALGAERVGRGGGQDCRCQVREGWGEPCVGRVQERTQRGRKGRGSGI